jgi:hypothetical protein
MLADASGVGRFRQLRYCATMRPPAVARFADRDSVGAEHHFRRCRMQRYELAHVDSIAGHINSKRSDGSRLNPHARR